VNPINSLPVKFLNSPGYASFRAGQELAQSGLRIEIAVNVIIRSEGKVMNNINTLTATGNIANIITLIGVDLAKNVFALHVARPILVRPCVRQTTATQVMRHVAHRAPGACRRLDPLAARVAGRAR
jgi:hypothetical protein